MWPRICSIEIMSSGLLAKCPRLVEQENGALGESSEPRRIGRGT